MIRVELYTINGYGEQECSAFEMFEDEESALEWVTLLQDSASFDYSIVELD